MADQSIRITDMPNAGSKEAVAFELWKALRYTYQDEVRGSVDKELAMFGKCLEAASGRPPSG